MQAKMVVTNSSLVEIICSYQWSCMYADITITNSTNVIIDCSAVRSCYQAQITVNNVDTLTMDCGNQFSCSHSTANIVANAVQLIADGYLTVYDMDVNATLVESRCVLCKVDAMP